MKEKIIPLTVIKGRRSKKKLASKKDLTPEIEALIERIALEHSNHSFGYLDKDDLRGEIWSICLEVIDEFEESSGKLEHFLRVSVKNRLVNKFKEITKSVRSPCNRCPYYRAKADEDCSAFKNAGTQGNPGDGRRDCDKWKNYQLSISSRNSLLNAVEHTNEQCNNDDPLSVLAATEMKNWLLKNLPPEVAADLQDVVDGKTINRQRHEKLKLCVMELFGTHNISLGSRD